MIKHPLMFSILKQAIILTPQINYYVLHQL